MFTGTSCQSCDVHNVHTRLGITCVQKPQIPTSHFLGQVQEHTSTTAGAKAMAISLGHFGAYVWMGVWGCPSEKKSK